MVILKLVTAYIPIFKSMVSDSTLSLFNNIEVGSRIECSDHYGTIRYIGLVEGYPSSWLGVEWDDASRGKHDGSVNNVRYFQTRHPTSGSFVRPGKVQFGRDAVTAITSRYGRKETDSEANVNQLQLLNLQKEINAPFLQMVGFDKINEKQSNFQDLQVISLRLQHVNGPGDNGELARICPNLVELDISKNLIHKWSDIFAICAQLPNLKWLNVSENYLQFPKRLDNVSFPQITSLICGQMNLSWNDVLQLSQIFPSVEEFRIQYNLITHIDIPNEHYFQSLKVFDLEGNNIQDWEEINKLGVAKNLEQLIVSNIGIKNIKFPFCELGEKLNIFTNLKQLVISDNFIDNWESISELNKLEKLDDLRFLKNPIQQTEKRATCLQLIVARIGNLRILNGTIIPSDERKGAEYDYVKKHGLEWYKVRNDESLKKEFLQRHPRYMELINKHGTPEESELEFKTQSLKTSLTAVNIHCNDRIISKKLPSTMSVQKLIMLIQKLFKLAERPNLYYISNVRPDIEIEMADEFKEIGFYSIKDGDTIYVRLS